MRGVHLIYIVLGLLLYLPGTCLLAEDNITPAFIDLDGDGLNDIDADNDNDGIPDRFTSMLPASELETPSLLGDIFSSTAVTMDLQTAEEKFGARKFNTRYLDQRCFGLCSSEAFGIDNKLGIGSGGGGGCAGGVCRP